MTLRIVMAAKLAALALCVATAALRDEDDARAAPAVIDLATAAGVRLVGGAWRVREAELVPAQGRTAAGAPAPTFDIAPRAGAAAFDDSAWRVLEPDRLDDEKLGAGKLCFAWYRIRVTVPERVGALATAGSTITFETVVDDYAEVWADGQLPIRLGAIGGQFAAGFNAPNRVVLTTDARPGQTIQIAVFGVNAPLSAPPDNFVFMRSAKLEFAPAVAK